MTFIAEWGDRSQIATIALGVSYSAVMVRNRAALGHFVCTMGVVEMGEWFGKRVK
jgi:putative Ca2+/H+ antiporter (TMEM165/GDT1 family)